MNPSPNVAFQAGAAFVVVALALVLCGDAVFLPIAICATVAATVWYSLCLRYYVLLSRRDRPRSQFRRTRDRLMLQLGAIGLLAPGAAAWILWAFTDALQEPVLDATSAAVGGTLIAVVPLTILASSGVDWYLILPWVRGVLGWPSCRTDVHSRVTSQAYGNYWMAHRTITEAICYVASSVAIAIIVNSLGDSADGDKTLVGALGAISSAGILAFAWPRLRHGWDYFFAESPGLGSWTRGRSKSCEWAEGVLADVSIDPGVKLRPAPEGPDGFVPLANRETLSEIRAHPPVCRGSGCGRWLEHCEIGELADDQRSAKDGKESRPAGV